MKSTLKTALERAMQPAVEHVEQAASTVPNGWGVDDVEGLSRTEYVRQVANRAVTITALRRGRTLSEAEKSEAYDYAKSLVPSRW